MFCCGSSLFPCAALAGKEVTMKLKDMILDKILPVIVHKALKMGKEWWEAQEALNRYLSLVLFQCKKYSVDKCHVCVK